MTSVQLQSVVTHLDALLSPKEYPDNSLNGLQVETQGATINKIAFAVDSGLSIIEKAVELDCGLLIVHHGLLWGECQPITGIYGRKINALLSGRCSLYASHLPLDGNPEVGNAFELARILELRKIKGFFEYNGMTIGAKAEFANPVGLDAILDQATAIDSTFEPLVLPFGKKAIQSVAIVTGSGWRAIKDCHENGIDLLISGEPNQGAYHLAKELEVNAIFLGHYATETTGVKALEQRLVKYFDIGTVFIDEPTGI